MSNKIAKKNVLCYIYVRDRLYMLEIDWNSFRKIVCTYYRTPLQIVSYIHYFLIKISLMNFIHYSDKLTLSHEDWRRCVTFIK